MNDAKIAGTQPTVMTLEPGTYYWCSCGQSENQPFCNGAHKGTGFAPQAFTIEESKKVALCLCKQTGNAPFCDGAHANLIGN
jgi:CDGSH-type Zn-finger protein